MNDAFRLAKSKNEVAFKLVLTVEVLKDYSHPNVSRS